MTATPENLQKLPAGSGYHKKDGQANLTVTKDEEGNIYIEASCDSLQRVITMYEEENLRLSRLLEEKVTEPPPCKPTGWQWFWIRFGQMTLIVVAGWFGIKKIKNVIKIKNK